MTEQPEPRDAAASNSGSPLAPIGGVVALAGFALLAVEVVRTLSGGVLGTIGTVLLWVGVGVLAVGLLLLVLSLAGGDDTDSAPLAVQSHDGTAGAIAAVIAAPAPVAEPQPATAVEPAPAPVSEPAPAPVAQPAPAPVTEPPTGDPVAAPEPPTSADGS